MKREEFSKAVGEALDSLPAEFRRKIRNVTVLVEDLPPNPIPSEPGQPKADPARTVSRHTNDPEERISGTNRQP